MQVDLWFDFSCPYAYLASRRIEAIAAARGAALRWRPMLLGGVFRSIGAGDGPMASLSPAKADSNVRDMHRWAERFGVPLTMPAAHPMRTVRSLRVLLGLPEPRWTAAIHAIYAAYWQRAEDVTRDDVLDAALADAGIAEADRRRAFAGADGDAIKDELRRRTDQAVALGIFGAPAMIVHPGEADPGTPVADRDPAADPDMRISGQDGAADRGRLFWGQDRLDWVDAALGGWDADRDPPPPGAAAWAPRTVRSRPTGSDPTSPSPIDFWFDLSSPFAYLGSTQIDAVAAAAGTTVIWRPFLLGALFRDIGTPDVPLLAAPEAKRRYLGRDLERWARWWQVPFRFPSRFPLRTVTALRLLLLAGQRDPAQLPVLARRLFRAGWAEERDLADEATLAALCTETGVDPALVAATREPAAKEALFAATAAARDAGVFGAPTCIVHQPEGPLRFWGQDRLALVADAAAGWRPAHG